MTSRRYSRGFTLVELVTTLIIVGVLAAVAAPRFFTRSAFEGRAFVDQSRSLLRYAQKVAIAQNRSVFVRLNGSSVALCFDSTCSAAAMLLAAPAGSNSGSNVTRAACVATAVYQPQWACEGIPAGMTYTSPQALFYFDASGQPYRNTDTVPVSTFTTPLTIAVTGDATPMSIVIEGATGYVH
ncbi:MAG TPA: prepilin-type N-terminal cleavage/methylation domain-containing protein [Burkholderiaceae bacterium]